MPQEQWKLQGHYKPWYVAWKSNSCDKRAGAVLKQYYETPFFLPNNSHSITQEWIFMGTPGFGASFHQDAWRHLTWQAQVGFYCNQVVC